MGRVGKLYRSSSLGLRSFLASCFCFMSLLHDLVTIAGALWIVSVEKRKSSVSHVPLRKSWTRAGGFRSLEASEILIISNRVIDIGNFLLENWLISWHSLSDSLSHNTTTLLSPKLRSLSRFVPVCELPPPDDWVLDIFTVCSDSDSLVYCFVNVI